MGRIGLGALAARGIGASLAIAGALCASQAQASESGASVYLLGTGGPGAAIMPPVQGLFFSNTAYYYSGSASGGKEFTLGGHVVADLKANVGANFPSVAWVPSTDIAGGTLLIGGVLPMGEPTADVSATIIGPLGRPIRLEESDSAYVIGDPLVTAALGWKFGDLNVQASTLINIPVGVYHPGDLANLAFHRWAEDGSLAVTWHDDKSGWDVSGKAGVTFNGENDVTDYRTGTEFHLEGAVEKSLSPAFSIGAQAFYYQQVTADSGSGAVLGAFEGEDVGVGGTAAYHFALGQTPMTLRLHGTAEVETHDRPQGEAIWLDLSFPLMMKAPTAPSRG